MDKGMREKLAEAMEGRPIQGESSSLKALAAAERRIKEKYDALGGEAKLGKPVDRSLGSIWYLSSSAIAYDLRTDHAYNVIGAIYQKWLAAGGMKLGAPCTDEQKTRDGRGRHSEFKDGQVSIYWSPETEACLIYGDIRKRWIELGAESSYLGYPTTDEVAFDEGGRANGFQHGDIYYWSDTGAIDLGDVVVHFTGLHAFGETDWDQGDVVAFGNGADEPYIIFALSTAKDAWTARTRIYNDVDNGEDRTDLVELYQGRPYGLNVGITLMEHDTGNADKYKDQINGVLMTAHTAGTAAIGFIPVAGPFIAAAVGPALGSLMPELGSAINDAFDWDDDRIGSTTVTMRAREMVLLAARTENRQVGPIGYKVESDLISGLGASYKAYLGIVPA